MEIVYGILNWRRDFKTVKKLATKLHGHTIVCTDDRAAWEGYGPVDDIIDADESVAVSKNLIIDRAKELGAEYLFIVEDDVIPIDSGVFDAYVSMMRKYSIDLAMYGYDNTNTVLDNKPNPCMIVNDGRGREIYVNRFVCSTVIGLRVHSDMVVFDERLELLETEYLAVDMVKAGGLPFNGFFFDVAESWNKFRKITTSNDGVATVLPRVRRKSAEMAEQDVNIRERISLASDANCVVNYIKDHREN